MVGPNQKKKCLICTKHSIRLNLLARDTSKVLPSVHQTILNHMASLNPLPGTLGTRRAGHLLRRSTYRYTRARVDELASLSADAALDTLLTDYPLQLIQPVFDDPATTGVVENHTWLLPPGLPLPAEDFVLRRYNMSWWINEALHDPGMGHKMTFFFHQYLAVAANSGGNANYFDYLRLLRWGAMGNFKKLATKMVIDNTMLRYLNNNENTKNNPNENFAREFLELFTIGKGNQAAPGDYTNYTEDDIVQAARVLTGIRTRFNRDIIDAETGIPRGDFQANVGGAVTQHDTASKTFSPRFQNTVITGGATVAAAFQELDDFVNMVFAQPETAKNFCRRLYRFFVHRDITDEIENDIIAPLANTFIANNFEVKPVLRQLLQSSHFFDEDDSDNADEIIGGIIKSPLELTLQAISFFNITIPSPTQNPQMHYALFYSQAVIDRMFAGANLTIFFPPDVAGYAAYYQSPDYHRQWFNSSTIIARYKLPVMLLTGTRQIGNNPNGPIGIKLNIAPWLRDQSGIATPSDAYSVVQELLDYMLPTAPDNDRFNYFFDEVFLDGLPPADWTYEWQNYITSGDATEVTLALERLVKAIMYSPEYQTF